MDLLCIRSLLNYHTVITSSIFYQLGPNNTISDDVSGHFDLPNDSFFIYLFSCKYAPTHSHGSCAQSHLANKVFSLVIFTLCKKMYHICHISSLCIFSLYNQWMAFCSDIKASYRLENLDLLAIDILQVYVHQVFHGNFPTRSKNIQSDLVATACRTIK